MLLVADLYSTENSAAHILTLMLSQPVILCSKVHVDLMHRISLKVHFYLSNL